MTDWDPVEDMVDEWTDRRCDQTDRDSEGWPLGPLDLYGDPLQDREPPNPYWEDDPWA